MDNRILPRSTGTGPAARALATIVIVATVVGSLPAVAAGQQSGDGTAETGSSTSSTTDTTTPTTGPSTSAPVSDTTSSTAPAPSTPASSTPSSAGTPSSSSSDPSVGGDGPTPTGAEPTTTTDPSESGSTTEPETDTTPTTADPLIGEAPSGETLDPNITVPPPTGAADNPDFAPVPLMWGNIRAAEDKWAAAIADRVAAIAEVRSLRLRYKELTRQRATLEDRTQQTIDDLLAATERLQDRAVRGFVQASSGNADGVLLSDGSPRAVSALSTEVFRSRELLLHQRRTRLVRTVVDVDQAGLGELAELRESLGSGAGELVQRWGVVRSSLRRAETVAVELETDIEQARVELEAFRAGSDIYIDGVVFPIGGEYSTPLINSFGFPRMPGTPDAHAHEGIDIFAPRGTPLVAAERGVIGRVGNGRLGGLKFWLRGESGADWYYAHLDGFAPGLANGKVVEAGELLGYVGNTGNAIGTPPHLHLEIHPGGGAAVNPYPLMKVVSDLDMAAIGNGTHPGHRYQAVVGGRSTPETSAAPGG